MKELNSEIFKKNRKRNNIFLIIGLLLLLVTGLLIYLGINNQNKPLPKAKSLNEEIVAGKNQEYVYSYIDVNTIPYLFAVYETDGVEENNKYYFVMDKNNLLYIVYMNEENYQKLNKETIKDNPIRITGLTKKTSNEIKATAISSYNKVMEEEYLTEENFNDYVGSLYLDMVTPIYDSSMYYLGATLSGLFAVIILIICLVIFIKNKKIIKKVSLEELANVDAEIINLKDSDYAKLNLYLLNKYLVDLGNNIIILKYEDILWAYPYEQRYNGVLINKCIKLVDVSNKKYDIATSKIYQKNKDEQLQEIIRILKEKNKDLITGFTKENKNVVKEKIKSLKKQK